MIGYKTSKDYSRLKELLDKGYDVVCLSTYDFNVGDEVTDVCKATKYDGIYSISARGIEYTTYWPGMHRYKSFEEACRESNIEFFDITE